jgi:cobalt-precorrin-5B (C1)-methyltransferase
MVDAPAEKKPLRTGWTTGACSAAAAKAAAVALVGQRVVKEIEVTLPIRKKHTFAVERCEFTPLEATCSVIKDAGDDPDCTHGAHLTATVSWTDKPDTIELDRGQGVAVVTKVGLGLEVGGPAINPVPRKNITEMVREGAGEALATRGVRVIISVPGGLEMAKKTQNDRLGLFGGISILGTTGIVIPFSTAAYKASISQGIDVAIAAGCATIALTTGGKSEEFLMKVTGLPGQAFIQMGDFVGFSIKDAARKKVPKVVIGGMPGKMSKIAKGKMQTHAAGSDVDLEFLAQIGREAGAPPEVVEEIQKANTARHVQEIVEKRQVSGYWDLVARKVCEHCRRYVEDRLAVECILVDFVGKVIGRASLGE